MSALLREDTLKDWLGFKRQSDLEKWLRTNNISYRYGKGHKIVTTQTAVDRAFGGSDAANQEDEEDGFF